MAGNARAVAEPGEADPFLRSVSALGSEIFRPCLNPRTHVQLEPSFVQVTLQQMEDDMFAVIRLLDRRERLIEERKLLMVPDTD
jgi:hypothetical protein